MSERHITREEAAQWVSGLMEGAEATELERHVATCQLCEGLVQTEARVELALGRVVASAPAVSNVVPLRRTQVVIAVVAVVALAASLALVMRPKPQPKADPEPAAFTVIELEAGDEVEGIMHVPRYEDGHELPALALTANEPFPL